MTHEHFDLARPRPQRLVCPRSSCGRDRCSYAVERFSLIVSDSLLLSSLVSPLVTFLWTGYTPCMNERTYDAYFKLLILRP